MNGHKREIDWGLIAEIGLIVVLIGLGIALYLYPAADGILAPRWWHWVALAAFFFVAVGMVSYRRRTRSRAALHQAMREESGASPED